MHVFVLRRDGVQSISVDLQPLQILPPEADGGRPRVLVPDHLVAEMRRHTAHYGYVGPWIPPLATSEAGEGSEASATETETSEEAPSSASAEAPRARGRGR